MRYKGFAGALVLLTLLLPISADAETIFWLDRPNDGATVFGLVEATGFVVDDGQQCGPQWTWNACQWQEALVSKIDLYVDNEFVASADIDQPRYDILLAYPWYAGTPVRQARVCHFLRFAGLFGWVAHALHSRDLQRFDVRRLRSSLGDREQPTSIRRRSENWSCRGRVSR